MEYFYRLFILSVSVCECVAMSAKDFYGKKKGEKSDAPARKKLAFPASSDSAEISDPRQPPITYDFQQLQRSSNLTPRKVNFVLRMLDDDEKRERDREEEEDEFLSSGVEEDDSDFDPDYQPSGDHDDNGKDVDVGVPYGGKICIPGKGGYRVGVASPRKHLVVGGRQGKVCLLYTSPSPRDGLLSRMPSSA